MFFIGFRKRSTGALFGWEIFMVDLPNGTATFLFTDIEGSTKLWEQHPEAMKAALARHMIRF